MMQKLLVSCIKQVKVYSVRYIKKIIPKMELFSHCYSTTPDGSILIGNKTNVQQLKIYVPKDIHFSASQVDYCNVNGEIIDSLSKFFTQYSIQLLEKKDRNEANAHIKALPISFESTNNLYSPIISYYHLISFLSGDIYKSNKSASLKFIQSYCNDVWITFILTLVLLSLTSHFLDPKCRIVSNLWYYFRIGINQTVKLKRSLITSVWMLAVLLLIQHFNSRLLSNIVYVPMNKVETLDDVLYQVEYENVKLIHFHIDKWKCSRPLDNNKVNKICDFLIKNIGIYEETKYLKEALTGNKKMTFFF